MKKLGFNSLESLFSHSRYALHHQYIEELSRLLNSVHNTNYSVRFWAILIEKDIHAVLNSFIHGNEIRQTTTQKKISLKSKLISSAIRIVKDLKRERFNPDAFKEVMDSNDNLFLHLGKLFSNFENYGVNFPSFNFLDRRNTKQRKALLKGKYSYDDKVINQFINTANPYIFENFRNILNQIPIIDATNKTFHVMHFDKYSRIIIALYKEHGAKLYFYQHGGDCGLLEFATSSYRRFYSDVYRTWGWSLHEKDQPWFAYRLNQFYKEYNAIPNTEEDIDLLIVMGDLNSSWSDYDFYKNNFKVFFESLDFKKYKRIAVRPRPFSRVSSNKREMDFFTHYPNVQVSSGLTSIHSEIKRAKVVLQVYFPGTNFLECVCIDKPVVSYYMQDGESSVAKPYNSFFEANGIYHRNYDSLAKFFNHLEVDTWWDAVKSSNEYQNFKKHFANINEIENYRV